MSIVTHRAEGGDPTSSRALPGAGKFESITLERGVTHASEFLEWARQVNEFGDDEATSPWVTRRDLTVEVRDEHGSVALTYRVCRCWMLEFEALPELDANTNAVAIQALVLQNEGWGRDGKGGGS